MSCCGSRTTQKAMRGHSHHGRRRTARATGVPAAGGGRVGLLRMAITATVAARDPARWLTEQIRAVHTASRRHLRRAACPRRVDPRPGFAGGSRPGGDVDGPRGDQGTARHAPARAPARDANGGRSCRANVHPRGAESVVGHRHHRTPHLRGQGVLRGGAGHVLPARRRLVDRFHARPRRW